MTTDAISLTVVVIVTVAVSRVTLQVISAAVFVYASTTNGSLTVVVIVTVAKKTQKLSKNAEKTVEKGFKILPKNTALGYFYPKIVL